MIPNEGVFENVLLLCHGDQRCKVNVDGEADDTLRSVTSEHSFASWLLVSLL